MKKVNETLYEMQRAILIIYPTRPLGDFESSQKNNSKLM